MTSTEEVRIRPLGGEDRAALADGFERLSPESRYRRFFAPMAQLSERHLDLLTDVDHHDREALVAVEPDGRLVGVARYVRTSAEVAEPAIVVVDEWQGRGIGSRLLGALARRARDEGVVCFQASVLASNDEAIRALSRLGATEWQADGPEVQLTIELSQEPEREPDWRSLLRGVAGGALQPPRTLIEMVWPRRAETPGTERANLVVLGVASSGAGDALPAAADLARQWGSEVLVVGASRLGGTEGEIADAVARTAAELRDRELMVRELVVGGDPAFVLADAAARERARLIVVGAGERASTLRRLLGGVAEAVARRAPCAVLLARGPDKPRSP